MPYSKTTWVDGSEPAITAERLNKIETGIEDAHAGDIDDLAIGTAKIANAAVTTAKIGDAQVTNVKIASGVDAGKLTTGTLPIARIADNAISNAKLRDSAALSVIGRSANSTGDPGDIAAGTDGHVLRRSGTGLGFGQVVAAGIANGVIDASKIIAAGLSKYVVNFALSANAGQTINLLREDTTFQYSTFIADYTPKAASNTIILVWVGTLEFARSTLSSGTTLGGEIQLSTGSGSTTPITGGLTRVNWAGLTSSADHVRRQRVTTFAAFSAGSTTARNYGRGFRVLETGQRLIIANGQALEQMFVLEIGA